MHIKNLFHFALLTAALCVLASCSHSTVKVIDSKGQLIRVDSTWDISNDSPVSVAIQAYKAKFNDKMSEIIGKAQTTLRGYRPESPLSNLAADIIKKKVSDVLGKSVDFAVMNDGGLRSTLYEGNITVGHIYEIFPFENHVVAVILKGEDVLHLFEEIAKRGGEGISGAQLQITSKGELVNCNIGGKPINPNALYTIGTIDYVAEGNDGMPSFKKSVKRQDYPDALMRDVFFDFVKSQTAQGKVINSQCENRIRVVEP